MKQSTLTVLIFLLIGSSQVYCQAIELEKKNLTPVGVNLSISPVAGRKALRITKNPEVTLVDQPTFVRINGVDFKDGTIEISVLSKLLPDAPELARGFIGIAFRINDDNSKFECIYVRPANARSDDQLRRNHTIQYFSFPDFPFSKTRQETPGKYESYADMTLNEWIKLKIAVKGPKAQLYINDSDQPFLIVNDLKHGADSKGGIGLWVDVGTDGYFSDLKVFHEK